MVGSLFVCLFKKYIYVVIISTPYKRQMKVLQETRDTDFTYIRKSKMMHFLTHQSSFNILENYHTHHHSHYITLARY